MTKSERIWWCAAERRAVPEHEWGEEVLGAHDVFNRACSPNIQCTIGRRQALPCGWYLLVPIDDEDDE